MLQIVLIIPLWKILPVMSSATLPSMESAEEDDFTDLKLVS
jgi:hypothetical protein